MLYFESILVKKAQESLKVDHKNVFVILGKLEDLTVSHLFAEKNLIILEIDLT